MSVEGNSNLNTGRIGELLAQVEFLKHGFHIYEPAVDDIGIDFLAEKGEDCHLYVQVKTVTDGNYAFVRKSVFRGNRNFIVAYIKMQKDDSYDIYFIPGNAWSSIKDSDKGVLSHKLYDKKGQTSEEEYGIRGGHNHDKELKKHYSTQAFFSSHS